MTSCWLDINYGTVLWTCVWFILQKKNKPRGQQVTLHVLNSARINWESSLNFFEKRIQQCGISGKKKKKYELPLPSQKYAVADGPLAS